ncbi:MAG: lysophospholipid acyltransferase family protein [Thermodesulfobacteriota bacterium]
MRQTAQGIPAFCRIGKPLWDVVATTCFWLYFTLGFVCIFAPLYLIKLFSPDRETAYQRLNSLFYRGFFQVVRVLTPGLTIRIDPAVYALKSCVIVSNHLSYLDPLLFISIFEKHKTIVKHSFFHIPIFRSVIKAAGYIPSSSQGDLKDLTLQQMEAMPDFLASGGNLFVFPEGTMRKDGITSFHKGAFSIARRCQVPLQVVYISNTHRLFPPGRFLFNTCVENRVSVDLLGTIHPGTNEDKVSLSHLMAQVRELLSSREGQAVS